MTRDEVRAAAKRLMAWHQRFARWFGRKEAQEHSLVYLKGLMSDQKWKSVEPMALRFARGRNGAAATQKEVVALQGFITASPWLAFDVFREIQAVFAEELMPTAQQWSMGTVGVIDESGFVKKGTESVGVRRQWCGRLGKKENCHAGVFLTGVTPGGTAFLGARLFLPEKWMGDRQRRRKTHVPNSVTFQSKPQVWYYVSNAGAETPWQVLAMVTGTRFRVEECFEDGKTHWGMAAYETRSWQSWHHHMSLVALAHLYVTLTKRDLKRDVPDLTLDMALQLLRSAFARSELSGQEAIDLVDYHRRRNRTAHDSHRKTWLRKHKRIKSEVLL